MAAIDPVQSIAAGSHVAATGLTLDNGHARSVHTAVCTASSGASGTADILVSQDNVNWIATALTVTASTVTKVVVNGAYRFVAASIGTISGGTVGITVHSAD